MARYVSTTEGIGRLNNGEVQLLATDYGDLGEALADGVDLDHPGEAPSRSTRPSSSVELLPPIVRPSKIWAVGWAYAKHRDEVVHSQQHDDPFIFLKAPSSVTATKQPIKIPPVAPTKLDYEGELVVVIGRRASAIQSSDALSYVAGFTIGNDVIVRDVQKGGCPRASVIRRADFSTPATRSASRSRASAPSRTT